MSIRAIDYQQQNIDDMMDAMETGPDAAYLAKKGETLGIGFRSLIEIVAYHIHTTRTDWSH